MANPRMDAVSVPSHYRRQRQAVVRVGQRENTGRLSRSDFEARHTKKEETTVFSLRLLGGGPLTGGPQRPLIDGSRDAELGLPHAIEHRLDFRDEALFFYQHHDF